MTIEQFAAIVLAQQTQSLMKRFNQSLSDTMRIHNPRVDVKPGKKYTKVDVNGAGRFMIDETGNIYGIKAYGVIHRGHHYGTLETVDQWYWGDYSPIKKQGG